MIPKRIKPDPIPAVRPQWEYLADDSLRKSYERYKPTFQAPWVGVFAMAYAHHRNFFDVWQDGLEELAQSEEYLNASWRLRAIVEEKVTLLNPPPIAARLTGLGYSKRELEEIQQGIEFFSHGNFSQLLTAYAARHLLEGFSLGSETKVTPFKGRHAPDFKIPFVMIEPHHGLDDLKTLYADVMEAIGLPFVNSDYRALCRWPSYFEMAWGDLRAHINTDEYEQIAQSMHDEIFSALNDLPNPGGLTSEKLIAAAEKDGDPENLVAVSQLFTWLISGLVTNVAFFRAQFGT